MAGNALLLTIIAGCFFLREKHTAAVKHYKGCKNDESRLHAVEQAFRPRAR